MAKITSGQLVKNLGSAEKAVNDPNSPIFKLISEHVAVSILRNVQAAGRPAWPARKKDYPWRPLVKTGAMVESAETSVDNWKHAGDEHVVEAKTPEYGAYQQYGTKRNLPARKYVKLTDQEREEILRDISNVVLRSLSGK